MNALLRRLEIPEVKKHISPGMASTAGAFLEWVWRSFGLAGEPLMTRFVAEQLYRSHWYDIEPARKAFGYTPIITDQEALDRTVKWWQSQRV